MITIERAGHVSAPIEEVWGVVSNVERAPEWIADVTRAELLEGDGLARRQRMYTRWGRRQAELDQVVTEWDPPHRIGWRHEAERIEGKPAPKFARTTLVSVALTEANGGTSVRMRADMEPASWLKGILMRLIATRRIGRHYDRSLEQLPRVVEAGS